MVKTATLGAAMAVMAEGGAIVALQTRASDREVLTARHTPTVIIVGSSISGEGRDTKNDAKRFPAASSKPKSEPLIQCPAETSQGVRAEVYRQVRGQSHEVRRAVYASPDEPVSVTAQVTVDNEGKARVTGLYANAGGKTADIKSRVPVFLDRAQFPPGQSCVTSVNVVIPAE